MKLFYRIMAVWLALSVTFVTLIAFHSGKPVFRAVICMALGLVILWCYGCGFLMIRYREPIRRFVLSLKGGWQLKFTIFCILLAMLEEAITTAMTNLAPLFGEPIGKAYITATSNYFDLIFFHSVIVFVPMFIFWAWMLARYDIRPAAVMLLFGATGTLAECNTGFQHLTEFGMWLFVYGWMIYLPAYCLPYRANLKKLGALWYPVAAVIPILLGGPVAGIILFIFHHPASHFPPIKT